MDLLRDWIWLWVIITVIFACGLISLIFVLINKCISRAGKHRITQLHRKSSDFTVKSNKYQERSFKTDTPPLPPRTQFLIAEAQSYENLAEAPDYLQAVPDCEQSLNDYEEATPDDVQSMNDYEEATPDNVQSMNDYEQATTDYEQATPDYEQATPDYEQATPDYEQATPDYEQATPDYEQATPDYEQATPDYEQATPDYEQAAPDYEQATPDYEQATPDYEQDVVEQSDYVKIEVEEEILPLPPPSPYKSPDPAADDSSTEDYDDIGGGEQSEEDYDDVG